MQCKACNSSFDTTQRCPRIIICCGHTICELCIKQVLLNTPSLCPICNFSIPYHKMEDFPKNFILIGKCEASTHCMTCVKHFKKLEAFCDTDKEVLCIDCILMGMHKQHNILSCEAALGKEVESITKCAEESNVELPKYQLMLSNTGTLVTSLKEKASDAKENATLFYMEIKNYLHERENTIKHDIDILLDKEVNDISTYAQSLEKYATLISKIKEEVINIEKEDTIQILANAKERSTMIQSYSVHPKEYTKIVQFPFINRETECNRINEHILNKLKSSVVASHAKDSFTGKVYSRTSKGYCTYRGKEHGRNFFNYIVDKSVSPKRWSHCMRKEHSHIGNITSNLINLTEDDKHSIEVTKNSSFSANTLIAKNTDAKNKQAVSQKIEMNSKRVLNTTLKLLIERPTIACTKGRESSATPDIKCYSKPISKLKEKKEPRKTEPRKNNYTIPKQISITKPAKLEQPCTSRSRFDEKRVTLKKSVDNSTISNKSSPTRNIEKMSIQILSNDPYSPKNDSLNSPIVPNEMQPNDCIQTKKKQSDQFDISATKSKLSITPSMLDLYKNVDKIDLSSLIVNMNHYILTISGYQKSITNSCEKYDFQKKQWKLTRSISKPKIKFAIANYTDSKIMIIGGKLASGNKTDEIEQYDTENDCSSIINVRLPKPRSSLGAVSTHKGVYIAGGSDGSILSSFMLLNFINLEWNILPDMHKKREEFGFTIGMDNKLYAIGGFDGKECLKSVERYDVDKSKWEPLAPLLASRRSLCAVTLPDGIYAIGGYDGMQCLCSVEKYSIANNKWSWAKPMNHKRCTFSAVVSPDSRCVYVMGGYDGSAISNTERYDITTESWELVESMNGRRYMHNSCIFSVKGND